MRTAFRTVAAPTRALRCVGAPSSFRVIAVPVPVAGPSSAASTSTSSSLSTSLSMSSARAFSSSAPAQKKKDKGGKKGKQGEDEDDAPAKKGKGKDKGGKKGKKGAAEEEGESRLTPEEIQKIADKTKAKMDKAVDWARGIVYDGVQRGKGHVSPAILDNIKVATADQGTVPLKSVASVTARQNTLYVDVWDTDLVKPVSSAIHAANLPGMSPQEDGSGIRIPVSRPTAEVRTQILKNLHETVETGKNQVRVARAEGLKALGGRGEDGTDDIQKLADDATAELEKNMQTAKKELEK